MSWLLYIGANFLGALPVYFLAKTRLWWGWFLVFALIFFIAYVGVKHIYGVAFHPSELPSPVWPAALTWLLQGFHFLCLVSGLELYRRSKKSTET